MVIGNGHPNGLKFQIHFKGLKDAVDLSNIYNMLAGLDEYSGLKEGYYVQVATYDFDGDKNPEIIIAIGNGSNEVGLNIVKYYPPKNPKDAGRLDNWVVVLNVLGRQKIELKNMKIVVPIGAQGRFKEYSWVDGKFLLNPIR